MPRVRLKIMRIFFHFAIIVLLAMNAFLCEASSRNDDLDRQSHSLLLNDKSLTLEDIERIVDQLLEERKKDNIDTIEFSNNLLNKIYEKREEDKRKSSIILLRMYQYSDAESSEFITQMLNELFYFHPRIVVSSLAEIQNHLLEEHRNEKYVDYLIQSACGIPQIVTEDINFSKDTLRKDASRIISEIKALNVDNASKNMVMSIVKKWE